MGEDKSLHIGEATRHPRSSSSSSYSLHPMPFSHSQSFRMEPECIYRTASSLSPSISPLFSQGVSFSPWTLLECGVKRDSWKPPANQMASQAFNVFSIVMYSAVFDRVCVSMCQGQEKSCPQDFCMLECVCVCIQVRWMDPFFFL